MDKNLSEVRRFILENIENHSSDIVATVANEFGFSRQRAHAYLVREIKIGKIIKVGDRRWTHYFLAGGKKLNFSSKINSSENKDEDRVWGKYIKPMVTKYSSNVIKICAYVFTEIFNNAIDHSGGTEVYTEFELKDGSINISILDNGIGIFKKIQDALHLESKREAILHLSKGKFTTDPSKHTGEGIFFTSRMLDSFSIFSDDLFYTFKGNDWFISSERPEDFGKGTYIQMVLSTTSTTETKKIFDRYKDKEIGFGKTIVAVALSADPGDTHVSRSQAKRLLVGLEKFKRIVLDFKGIESVGQAFVDEVFRVFRNEHPAIEINYFNTNEEVESMIKRGISENKLV